MSLKKTFILLGILSLALLVISIIYLSSGSFSISIFKYLSGNCNQQEEQIISSIRIPRLLIAIFSGAALAVAGALAQCLFKNPLASTGILGTDSAATLGAILAIFMGAQNQNIISLTSFAIALMVTFLVYGISFKVQSQKNYLTTLLLCGMAIATLCAAVSSILLAISLEDWDMGKRMVLWGFGNLENLSWSHFQLIAPIVCFCFMVIIPLIKNLNLLNLDDDSAQSLGVNLKITHFSIIVISTILASIIVSITGMIGFIGLICPHLVRIFTGNQYLKLLPFSALIGALFLVTSDLIIIKIKSNLQLDIKIGILTTLIGVPIFLYLLLRKNIQ